MRNEETEASVEDGQEPDQAALFRPERRRSGLSLVLLALVLAAVFAGVAAWLLAGEAEGWSALAVIGAALLIALAALNEYFGPPEINRYFEVLDEPSQAVDSQPADESRRPQSLLPRLLRAVGLERPFGGRNRQLELDLGLPRPGGDLRPIASMPRLDALIVCGLLVVAAFPRLWSLGEYPAGLHGDEALTGLDALRIQSEGWIGPYVGSALGQPSGPLYWTALVLAFMGETAYAVRLSMALLGILTVPVAYFAGRELYGRETGLIAAVLLAFMAWHLMFSRIAFMVISWPLFEVIVIALLFAAIRSQRSSLFVLAGAALGLGIYTYNVYPFFVIGVAIFACLYVLRSRQKLMDIADFARMFASALVFALPMFLYILEPRNDYFAHHRAISFLETEAYRQEDFWGRVSLLGDRAWDWLMNATLEARPNGVEGGGADPLLDYLTLGLVIAGLAICLRGIKQPANQLLLLLLLIIPIASVVSIDPGFRRSLGLAPVVALLAALPLSLLWRKNFSARAIRVASRAAVLVAIGAFIVINLSHFERFATSESSNWVYAREIASASEYLAGLPDQPYVYFFSGRWSFDYETRQYLAPDSQGEDRRRVEDKEQRYAVEPWRDSVFLLLPPYTVELPQLQERYPEGRTHIEEDSGDLLFIALHVAAEPSAEPPLASSGTAGVLDGRDEERLGELTLLAEVLEEYRERNGGYPDTRDQVQSACVYRELDVLCRFEDQVGVDTFLDPRLDGHKYGYWYASNGERYVLYATLEAPHGDDTCNVDVEPVASAPNLLCVRSPEP